MGEQANAKVLVVDDSASMRAVVSSIVKKMGFSVIGEAANGKEAVVVALRDEPDIVMLDINMPIKTGFEALQEIKADHPTAVVIMMTSVSDMETVEKCIEAGAAGYVLKSATHEEIAKSIDDAWEAGKAWQ
ncbi:MAG TPA: response regulator transcription factor [Planctomycetota bacterium]